MQLYTSYYAKHNNDPNAISISARAPAFFYGKRYSPLAPSWDLINGIKQNKITQQQYIDQYLSLLVEKRKLSPYQVVDDLWDGAIMLCYEAPYDFCHRHVVAEWITSNTGIPVIELCDPHKHDIEF